MPDAPTLIPGKIHAVRGWQMLPEAGTERVLLGSLASATIWPTTAATAECWAHPDHDEAAPAPACACGFYGLHPDEIDHEWLGEQSASHLATGVIEAWGRVEVHESGIRAERARVVALLVDTEASVDYLNEIGRAADTYGAEIVAIDGERALGRYLRERLGGLDEQLVERLLADSRTHVLEAAACGYISRRGEPIGGFGFRLEGDPGRPRRFQPELPTRPRGLRVLRVAGTSHHQDELQSNAFEPGRPLALVPEPDNPGDPNAVAVWDAERRVQVGYVPRRLASEIGERLAAGRIARVDSVWQWRNLRSGRRTDLHMLVSPTARVEFADGEQLALETGD